MNNFVILSICLLLVLLACDNDEADRNYARINQNSVQDITNKGVRLKAKIYDSGDELIEDHGFVYNLKSLINNEITGAEEHFEEHFEKQSLGSKIGDGSFESTLTRNLIKDSTYLAKAFLVSDGIIVYSKAVEFVSQGGSGPVIASFKPEIAFFGDTLEIFGNNFSNQIDYNSLKFADIDAKIVSASDTTLKVIVPKFSDFSDCFLQLHVGDKNIFSLKKFSISPPQIDSISSKYILAGRTVNVYGKHFNILNSFWLVNKSTYPDFNILSDTLFQFSVPFNIPVGKLPAKLFYLNQEIMVNDIFESTKPTIESIRPLKIFTDTIFQIRGTYLKSFPSLKSMGKTQIFSDSLIEVKITHLPYSNKVYGVYDSEIIMAKDSIEWLPPIVTSVDKRTVLNGDWITIYGDRFEDGIGVDLNSNFGKVQYINKNMIKFEIPEVNSGTYPLHFSYRDIINAESDVVIDIPEIKITGVKPTSFKRGDIIEVSMDNMNMGKDFSASVDENWAHVVGVYDHYVRVKVQNNNILSQSPTITIRNGGREASFTGGLIGQEPWEYLTKEEDFYLYDNRTIHIGETLIMSGRIKYGFGGYELYQFKENTNSWKLLTEVDNIEALFSNDNNIYCAYIDNTDYTNPIFKLKSYSLDDNKWEFEGEFQFLSENLAFFTFKKNNVVYFGNEKMMKAFDLENKQWSNKAIIPTNEWRVEEEEPFIINNRCFVKIKNSNRNDGRGDKYEIWEYDTDNDTWSYIPGCPLQSYVSSYTYDENRAYFFTEGGDCLKSFYTFDPLTNEWEKYLIPPGRLTYTTSFVHNGYIYFGYNEKYSRNMHLERANLNVLLKLE